MVNSEYTAHSTHCIDLRSAHIICGWLRNNFCAIEFIDFLVKHFFNVFSSPLKFTDRIKGDFVSSSHRATITKTMKEFSNQTVAAVFSAKKQSLFHRNFYIIFAKWRNSTEFDDGCEKYAVNNLIQ